MYLIRIVFIAGCPGTPIQHDPCNSSPCLNGGRCVTQLNTYRYIVEYVTYRIECTKGNPIQD